MSADGNSNDQWRRGTSIPISNSEESKNSRNFNSNGKQQEQQQKYSQRGSRYPSNQNQYRASNSTSFSSTKRSFDRAPAASANTVLTMSNLSRVGESERYVQRSNRRGEEDDMMSISSYSSISSFQSTFHSKQRLMQRDFSRDAIGHVIKRGVVLREEEGKALIKFENIIAIVSTPNLAELKDETEDAISNLVDIQNESSIVKGPKKVLVTAWRENSMGLDNIDEYNTYNYLIEGFTGIRASEADDMSKRPIDVTGEEFLSRLQAAADKHKDRLPAILDFTGSTASCFVKYTFLHLAVYHGMVSVVQKLIDFGCNVNAVANSKKKYTPIFYAFSKNAPPYVQSCPDIREQVVQLLLDTNQIVVDDVRNGDTILTKAIYLKLPTTAQVLLDLGADPDRKSSYGQTPREQAADMGLSLRFVAQSLDSLAT